MINQCSLRALLVGFGLFIWPFWLCYGQLDVDAGTNQTVCQDQAVDLGGSPTVSGGTAPYTYRWSPAAGLSCSNCANPQATPTVTTTYTLAVTDAGGTSARDQVTVTINPNPVLRDEFGSSNFIQCNGDDYQLTLFDASIPANNTSYKIVWGDGTPDFVGSTFPASGIRHTYASGRNYDLQYEITGANNCVSTRNYTVTNITNPGIGLEIPENTIGCGPKEICFPITGFESNHPTTVYTISFGDGADTAFTHPPPNQICHVYDKESCSSPNGAFVFNITASNNCNDTEAEVTPIKIFTPPQASFSIIQGCLNEPNTFINETEAGFNSSCESSARYTWDFGDGTTRSVFDQAPLSHTYTTPGDYIVTLTTENGCDATSFSDTVYIEEAAVSSFDMELTKECAPFGELVLTNTSSPLSNAPDAFEWSIEPETGATFRSTGTATSSKVNEVIDFAEKGDYTITLKYTTSCNEFLSEKEVSVDQQLTISEDNILNLEPVNCLPFTLQVTTDLEIDDPQGYQWVLKGAGVSEQPANANMKTPGQLELGPGNYTLELTVETNCGPSNTVSKDFSVTELPNVSAGEDMPVCESEGLVSLTGSPIGGTWSGICVSPDGSFNPACAGPSATGHQLVYTYGTGSCQTRDTLLVTVIRAFQPNAGSDRNFCFNDPVFDLLTEQDMEPTGGSWSFDGATISVFNPAAAGPGEHELVYSYTEPGAICAGTDIATFIVTGPPDINPGPARNFCIDEPVFDLSTQQGATPAGGSWTINGVENNAFNPLELGPGIHQVIYSFTDPAGGCAGEQNLQFTVNSLPQVQAGNPQTLCIDDPAYDLVASQNAVPSGGRWTINGTPGETVVPSILGAGVHQLEYAYTDPLTQCSSTSTVEFTVVELEDVGAGADMAVCLGEGSIDLNAKGDISRAGGEWTGPGVTNGMFDPQVTDIGIFEVYYTITDPVSSCSTSDAISISVYETPQVRAGWDVTLCSVTEGYTFRAHSPKGGTWDGPGILDANAGIFSPFLSGEGNHVVRYTYSNQFGCSKTDSLTVTVCADPQAEVQIPNAFTPNGDQLNDTFAPVMTHTTDVYKFQIADRSNQIVFDSEKPEERWDGTYNGMEMQGVFAYRLYVRFTSGLEVSREGEVLVIR